MRRILILAAVLAVAPGCSTVSTVKGWFQSEKSEQAKLSAPQPLTEIASAVAVHRLWSTGVGDGEGLLWLRQRPTVDGNRVYVVDDKGQVRAIDASTGKTLWASRAVEVKTEREMRNLWLRKSAEAGLTSSPGVGNGMVVVGGRNGEVVAFDADSGAQRWSVRVTSEVLGAPLVLADRTIVRSNDGRVFGLSNVDGTRKWVFDRGLPTLSVRGNSSPVAGGGLVFVGYDDGTVVAVRESDGLRAWEQRIAEPDGRTELDRMADIDGELQLGTEELFAASFHDQLMALAAVNGRPLWAREIGSTTGFALLGDRLLITDKAGNIWALDRSSGNELWKQNALGNRQLTTPAVQGDYGVVGDYDGYLHWFRTATGELVGRTRLDRSAVRGTPQVTADGVLIVLSSEGELAAYQLAN